MDTVSLGELLLLKTEVINDYIQHMLNMMLKCFVICHGRIKICIHLFSD